MEASYNPTCEVFEASLSALIDGELEAPEQLPAVDHLLECASCRDFYRQARALGSMVTSATTTSAELAPPEVWDRIATETGLAELGRKQRARGHRRYRLGALQLAAVLVAALGLWFLWPAVDDAPTSRPAGDTGVINVVLEQDRGSMSDERFLELTTEILKADRGYHRKMLEIMRVVDDLAAPPEGSGDEPAVAARDGRRRIAAEDGADNDSPWGGDRL